MDKKKFFSSLCIIIALAIPAYGIALLLSEKNQETDFSVKESSESAFSFPLTNLDQSESQQFILGQRMFHLYISQEKNFEQKGIGPTFNAFNCADCHVRDGRGDPEKSPSLVVKLHNTKTKDNSDPIYGKQINIRSVSQSLQESKDNFNSQKQDIEKQLAKGPLDINTFLYKRIAPPVFGAGLIEAIPDSWFKKNEDPKDKNNDGVYGRIGWVKDSNGKKAIGRFGWKATVASVKEQTLHAAFLDMGLTNSLFSSCVTKDSDCKPKNDITIAQENNLAFYVRALAPPSSRTSSKEEKQGKKIFTNIGCATCHTISVPVEKTDITKTSNGIIYPHSNFLLHSMGPKLADPSGFNSRKADEFRTAPLWGLGLQRKVNGSLNLLHDGRAKSIEEAIYFHGGEAQKSNDNFNRLSNKEKAALLAYLNSL